MINLKSKMPFPPSTVKRTHGLDAPILVLLFMCLMALIGASPARAHDGHDHAEDEPPAVSAPQASAQPHADAQTESFEIVAELSPAALGKPAEGERAASSPPRILTLHVDDFATNAPVADAKVEVESGAFKAKATMKETGVYTLPADALAKAGRHPLTISVETETTADLLNLTLDTREQDQEAHVHEDGTLRPWQWGLGIAAAVLMAGVIGTQLRQRRQRRQVMTRTQ